MSSLVCHAETNPKKDKEFREAGARKKHAVNVNVSQGKLARTEITKKTRKEGEKN